MQLQWQTYFGERRMSGVLSQSIKKQKEATSRKEFPMSTADYLVITDDELRENKQREIDMQRKSTENLWVALASPPPSNFHVFLASPEMLRPSWPYLFHQGRFAKAKLPGSM